MSRRTREDAHSGRRIFLSLLLAGAAVLVLAGVALAASSPAPDAKTLEPRPELATA
jgi:hypothetical protein